MAILSPAERAAALRAGMYMKFAEMGLPPGQIDPFLKQAFSIDLAPGNVAKVVTTMALLTGIPVGIAAYHVSKAVNKRKQRELEMAKQIEYYRTATEGLSQALPANA